jgi:hypothetical protein
MRRIGIVAVPYLIALVVAAAHSVGGKAGWSDPALLVAPIHRTARKRRFFDHAGRCI